jgi:ABC-type bacteriocin/lantibiotic exporter with double-glycine peptidase domain
MKKNIIEIFYIMGDSKKKIPFMLFLFLILSVLDVVGISLVVPYLSLLSGSNEGLSSSFDFMSIFFTIDSSNEGQLITFGYFLMAVFTLKTFLIYVINKKVFLFGNDNMINVRNKLMINYQSMSYSKFIESNSADYINVIINLTNSLSIVLANILKLVSDVLIGISILILLMVVDIVMLIELLAILFSVIWAYDRIFKKRLYLYGEAVNSSGEIVLRRLKESFDGFKEIRVLGREKYFYDIVEHHTKKGAEAGIKASLISIMPRYIIELIMLLFIVVIVFLAILLSEHGIDELASSIILFGVASVRLIPVFSGISSGLSAIRHHRHSIYSLYQNLKNIKYEKSKINKHDKVESFNKLILSDISFSYQKVNKPSISNISLELRSNEAIGIIGASGSGKTTLVNIMLGLLSPDSGSISYNGTLFSEGVDNWRSQVAYLPQQVFLVDGTLCENIALGETKIDDKLVTEALRKSKLLNWVEELPNGIKTVVGESGVRLSGGQRQRVALARAFYFERSVLVMDEATSALDSKTEKEIVDEINSIKGKMTVIVIAHRLSTVKYCDRIYRLENGSIIQEGSYNQVT